MGNKKQKKGRQLEEPQTNQSNRTQNVVTDMQQNNMNASWLNVTDMLGQSREVLYGQNVVQNQIDPNQIPNTLQNTTYVNNVRTGHEHPPMLSTNQFQHSAQVNPSQLTGQVNQHVQGNCQPGNGQWSDNNIPQWAIGLCQQINSMHALLDGNTKRWHSVESSMVLQNEKLNKMETKMSEISNLKQELISTNTKVYHVQNELDSMQSKITNYDQTIKQYSDMYDDITTNNTDTDRKIRSIEERLMSLERTQVDNDKRINDTNVKLTDLRWRSMRENLLFFGFPEAEINTGEDCEMKVKTFFREEMDIEQEIPLDRAHRLGRYNPRHIKPRPIVVKFTFFKDKELIRLSAPQLLIGTAYGVSEQYPPEIEDKRRSLYGVAKAARENKNNKVKLVRDKLYINDKLYHSQESQDDQTTYNTEVNSRTYRTNKPYNAQQGTKGQRTGVGALRQPNRDTAGDRIHWTRTFTRTTRDNNVTGGATGYTQTNNRFSVLRDSTPQNQDNTRPNYGGKKKATSPLEDTETFKKQHYDGYSSDVSSVYMDLTQATDNTQQSPSLLPNHACERPPADKETAPNMTLQPSPIITLPMPVTPTTPSHPKERVLPINSDCNNHVPRDRAIDPVASDSE